MPDPNEQNIGVPIPGATDELVDDVAIPDLDVKVVSRSNNPLVSKEAAPSQYKIFEHNGYIILQASGSSQLRIFTKEGEELTDLGDNANLDLQRHINGMGEKLAEGQNHNYFVMKAGSNSGSYSFEGIQKLPEWSRKYIENLFSSSETIYQTQLASIGGKYRDIIRRETLQWPRLTGNRIISFSQTNDYMVAGSRENGSFVAYITQRQGKKLAPRNWVKLTPFSSDVEEVPEELIHLIDQTITNGTEKINENYSIRTQKEGIEIIPSGGGEAVFTEKTPNVREICRDPNNENIIYYCSGNSPSEIVMLDLSSGDPSQWQPHPVKLPKRYLNVEGLSLDPTGTFFVFSDGSNMVFLNRGTLKETVVMQGYRQPQMQADGQIVALDQDNHLVLLKTNAEEIRTKQERQKAAALVSSIKIEDLFRASEQAVNPPEEGKRYEHLAETAAELREKFRGAIADIKTLEDVDNARKALSDLKKRFLQSYNPGEADFLIGEIRPVLDEKTAEIAGLLAEEGLGKIEKILAQTDLMPSDLTEIRDILEQLESNSTLIEPELRKKLVEARAAYDRLSEKIYREKGSEIIRDAENLFDTVQAELDEIKSMRDFDNWMEALWPQRRSRIIALLQACPVEIKDVTKKLMEIQKRLYGMRDESEKKFLEHYDEVRQGAVEIMDERVSLSEEAIRTFFRRMERKKFKDRNEAERHIDSSEDYQALIQEIEAIQAADPDRGKVLARTVKVERANLLSAIDRGQDQRVSEETGQSMVALGREMFPRWEARVRARGERRIEMTFMDDPKSHGPGKSRAELLGEIGLTITNSDGTARQVRLYEGMENEDEWRLGLQTVRGLEAAAYVSVAEYRDIARDYRDWSSPDSKLRAEDHRMREALHALYRERPKDRESEEHQAWEERYKALYGEYINFRKEHNIAILNRYDQVGRSPETKYVNGHGFVPEWQNHWVVDAKTIEDLEHMAYLFKRQSELQEGALNLIGHAGTGKDVLLKIFCHMTNRPLFSMDCTKWTTEYELGEDVILQSEDGASVTVRVPSVVLNAVQTPGAVLYLNEFSAMTEPAQIFLHALLDEKRTMTLKTRPGEPIRAERSVLFATSMNMAGTAYEGTNKPQAATQSRLVNMPVGYIPLNQPNPEGDNNPNPGYNSAEALRLAREVDSLSDLTYDPDLNQNEFVTLWNNYVNGIENGAPAPTQTQQFDLEVLLALVQFSDKLRQSFISTFEEQARAGSLQIRQPLTGRELRRCAYDLSHMDPEEKLRSNPEETARRLLEQNFLTALSSETERSKATQAMQGWSSNKRVRA